MNVRQFILPLLAIVTLAGAFAVDVPVHPPDSLVARWKPNKVLLVVGSQWGDPNSEIIDGLHDSAGRMVKNVKSDPSIPRTSDTFWRVAAYLKTCSIPFDILRLDQSELRLNYFLDHHLRAAYGAMIWDVDTATLPACDYAVVTRAVTDYGISLIALSHRSPPPALQALLGLRWSSPDASTRITPAPYRFSGEHYITRGFAGDHLPVGDPAPIRLSTVGPTTAVVLATQHGRPVVAVRELNDRASAVWLGGDPEHMMENYPFLLRILRRALVHGIGYSTYRTFPRTAIFRMDDPTCTAMFRAWHFPALTEQEVVDWIVQPLQERKAVMQLNMVPGRLMDSSQLVEPNWTQDYTDAIGDRQNLISNGRGWRRGLEAGVFEVQSHGWTHRNPDWKAYWAVDLDHRLDPRWGGEFYNRINNLEVTNAVQLFALRRSLTALEETWGQRPLYFVPGQDAETFSYVNSTPRMARKAGFALTQDFWLGPDYVINLLPFLITPKVPWVSPKDIPDLQAYLAAPVTKSVREIPGLESERPVMIHSHDIDVSRDHDYVRKRLAEFGPEFRFTTINEIIAYLFADVRGDADGRIEFNYAPEFCRHFQTRDSSWELHLSDNFRRELNRRGPAGFAIDGKLAAPPTAEFFQERMDIPVPVGTGRHTWEVRR